MNLRTTFTINPSSGKIGYDTPVMFIGSCFASEIGAKMAEGKMKVLINPTGVVYNPVSVGDTINIIIDNKILTEKDLYLYNGMNLSFSHYTDFSSEEAHSALDKINAATFKSNHFLRQAKFLFVTFGTSRVFRFEETGKIVSNCHKLPASFFSRELLTVEEITSSWKEILNKIHSFNKNIKVIFTISPVRHWKDGAHGNQVSKSILFLAIENLLNHPVVEGYFPAYEIVMDDLRDYRYYAEDMLHPSKTTIEYIWNGFSDCYFHVETACLWKDILGIRKAINHRLLSDSPSGKKEFANNILKRIALIENKNPDIDLSEERSYFTEMIM